MTSDSPHKKSPAAKSKLSRKSVRYYSASKKRPDLAVLKSAAKVARSGAGANTSSSAADGSDGLRAIVTSTPHGKITVTDTNGKPYSKREVRLITKALQGRTYRPGAEVHFAAKALGGSQRRILDRSSKGRLLSKRAEKNPLPTKLAKTLPDSADSVEFVNSLGPWAKSDLVAKRFGLTRTSLGNWRAKHKLLGVQFGHRGEFYYPAQQFDESGVVSGVQGVLTILSPHFSTLTIASMLAQPAYADADDTYWDVLRSGEVAAMADWASRTVSRMTGA